MRTWFTTCTLAAALAAPALLPAQDNMAPPKWMTIQRELVKPGKEPAHMKLEVEWTRAVEAAKFPVPMLGLTSMSGANEVWFMQGFASAADMQKLGETMAAAPAMSAVDAKYRPMETDMLANQFTMIVRLRDDLSYTSAAPLPSMRYMTVTRVSVKIGHVPEFEDARKIVKAAHEKIRAVDGYAVFQVTMGAPAGTFLVMAAKKGMADFDTDPHGDAYVTAIGGPEGQKKLREMSIAYENTADTQLFAVNPAISTMGSVWGDADAYWKPKATKK